MNTTLSSEEYMKRMANGDLIDFRDLPNRYHISRIAQEELNRALKEKSDKDYLEAKKFLEASNISNLDINASILIPAPNLLPPLPRSKYEVNITLLKEILVRDLELKRNEGYYFRGKVIMKPWKMPGPSCAVNTLLEDRTGDIARINCYNVLATEDWSKFERIFSIGREVIILHPFFKQTKDGLVSIRVENRYEFYFGDEAPANQLDFEALLQKSKTFKDEGNQELKTNLNSALDKYHKSLEVFLKRIPKLVNEKDDFLLEWTLILDENQKTQALSHLSIVFSNCSLISIEKSRPLMALHYAKFSVWCNEKFFKGKLRLAKALIDLLYVYEAEELLNDLKSQNPTAQFQEEIDKLSIELIQTMKEYTSPDILVKFLRNELDLPEDKAYVGPMKLFTTEGKGRNFMARRDIAKGEILLMEKGFVCNKENPEFSYQLINRLDRREDIKMLYMNLFPTSRIPIHKALKESSEEKMKEYTLRTEFDVFWRDHPSNWENFSNNEISELLAKSRYNSYKSNGRPALFPFMCLINHSCDPNTSVWYAGDMVLILAQRNIRKGEEIFVTYIPLSDNKFQRRTTLLNYGFDCDCTRCEEKQGWKQKAPKLDGIRCPKCFIEIASNSEGKFICPKGCWEGDFSYFEELDKKFTALLPQIKEWAEKQQHSQLENYLKTIDKQFSEYHRNKEIVLYDLARSYAISRDEKNFKKWFLETIKMIEFHALPELRMILNSLLVEIINNFEREPTEEELGYFNLFGLDKEAVMGLWQKYMKTGDIEWFLPFELRD